MAKHNGAVGSNPADLAVKSATALGQALDYGAQAGAGFDNQTTDDIAVPFIAILQALSPEVSGPAGEKIKGASAGMLMNTVTKEMFDGETGIIIQPCDTAQKYVEWKPDQGGFVAQHDLDSPVVKAAIADSKNWGKYKTPAGNDLVQTFYMAALLHRSDNLDELAEATPEPVILAFTSTKIKPYQSIVTRLRSFSNKVPLFAHRLRVTTVSQTFTKGTAYNFSLAPVVEGDVRKSLIPSRLGETTHPLLLLGQALLESYRGGLAKPNHDSAKTSEDGSKIPF